MFTRHYSMASALFFTNCVYTIVRSVAARRMFLTGSGEGNWGPKISQTGRGGTKVYFQNLSSH